MIFLSKFCFIWCHKTIKQVPSTCTYVPNIFTGTRKLSFVYCMKVVSLGIVWYICNEKTNRMIDLLRVHKWHNPWSIVGRKQPKQQWNADTKVSKTSFDDLFDDSPEETKEITKKREGKTDTRQSWATVGLGVGDLGEGGGGSERF